MEYWLFHGLSAESGWSKCRSLIGFCLSHVCVSCSAVLSLFLLYLKAVFRFCCIGMRRCDCIGLRRTCLPTALNVPVPGYVWAIPQLRSSVLVSAVVPPPAVVQRHLDLLQSLFEDLQQPAALFNQSACSRHQLRLLILELRNFLLQLLVLGFPYRLLCPMGALSFVLFHVFFQTLALHLPPEARPKLHKRLLQPVGYGFHLLI